MVSLSEDLTGTGGFAPKKIHSQSPPARAGCWLEASVPHVMGLSIWLLEHPWNKEYGLPQSEWSERERDRERDWERPQSFLRPSSPSHTFISTTFHLIEASQVMKSGPHSRREQGECQGICEHILELSQLANQALAAGVSPRAKTCRCIWSQAGWRSKGDGVGEGLNTVLYRNE